MFKSLMIGLTIAVCVSIAGLGIFLAGMSHSPQQLPSDEMDFVQGICDLSRKEPWKEKIKTSCAYVQEYTAINYKCEEIRGCFTERISDGEIRF